MSCIQTGEEPTNLEEGIPNTHLFTVHVMDSYFEDIIHFMMTGMDPKVYTSQQKKELVVRTIEFSIIARHLYKIGSDETLQCYV